MKLFFLSFPIFNIDLLTYRKLGITVFVFPKKEEEKKMKRQRKFQKNFVKGIENILRVVNEEEVKFINLKIRITDR